MSKLTSYLNNYFQSKGNIYLVVITAIEFIFYIAYTAIYYVNRENDKDDPSTTGSGVSDT